MNAMLCPEIEKSFAAASEYKNIFSENERKMSGKCWRDRFFVENSPILGVHHARVIKIFSLAFSLTVRRIIIDWRRKQKSTPMWLAFTTVFQVKVCQGCCRYRLIGQVKRMSEIFSRYMCLGWLRRSNRYTIAETAWSRRLAPPQAGEETNG